MTPTITCAQCGQIIQFTEILAHLGIYTPERSYPLCSYGCMTELSWTLREAQPKLSKSKANDALDTEHDS